MRTALSASYSMTVRLEIRNRPGMLGKVTSAMGPGGDIGALDLVQAGADRLVRDITFNARDEAHGRAVVERLTRVAGIRVRHVSDRTFLTGRSDYPNQINNVLCFPGFFRGLLDVRARLVNDAMKIEAARGIASIIRGSELSEEYVIPSVFDKRVVEAVADGVARAAAQTGVARRRRRTLAVGSATPNG
jgi:Malic enzyme, NAD binding domain